MFKKAKAPYSVPESAIGGYIEPRFAIGVHILLGFYFTKLLTGLLQLDLTHFNSCIA